MLNNSSNSYPVLSKSYKGVYPFKLCTPSFIYPDHYVPNVELLGPFVDEIELLLFESAPADSLLSSQEINALSRLSQELNLTYNIHLPTDISIGDPDPVKQQQAVDALIRVVERVAPLHPTTYTLHVPYDDNLGDKDKIKRWQEIVHRNLVKILATGVGDLISIETLDYPFDIIETIISDLNMSICLDLGHLIVHGEDLKRVSDKYLDKTSIIHLHGVADRNDHLALDRLSKPLVKPVFELLGQFSGSVSLEVFSFENLNTSLAFLERYWATVKGG
ncbi:MAG: cobamide remodeling phosphodiesterase CbiR [Desulfobacterales bacterium]|jgi:sugar phosphate isomerase/epimerase